MSDAMKRVKDVIELYGGGHDTSMFSISEADLQWLIDRVEMLEKFVPTHRHNKRGTDYQVIGDGIAQTSSFIGDEYEVTVYKGEDGKIWVRDKFEFNDGRFKPLKPIDTP